MNRTRSILPSPERKKRDLTPKVIGNSNETDQLDKLEEISSNPSKNHSKTPKTDSETPETPKKIDPTDLNHSKEDRGRSRTKNRVISTEIPDDMISLMGFAAFGSTKHQKVNPSNSGAVESKQTTNYRQYVNRQKNNKPLDKS